MPRCSSLLTVLAVLLGGLVVAAAPANATDRDCADFSTQGQAQQYFLSRGGPAQDPDRLDADGDGRACDSLPCPCSYSTQPVAASPGTIRQRGRVTRVVDGDTIDVRLRSGATRRVRLLGIDTPEVYGAVECYGPEASRATRRILPRGTRILLVSDPTQARKDRYGRLLRYVSKGPLDVNRRLLRLGAARVYVYQNRPFRRVSTYRAAQSTARANNVGLWGRC